MNTTNTTTKVPFDFQEAAEMQYLRSSYYTVWVVSPEGTRTYLGCTARKSGTGLINVVTGSGHKKFCEVFSGLDSNLTTLEKKTKDTLILRAGWKVTFGGTIREESGN
jgi:hypothetical protein